MRPFQPDDEVWWDVVRASEHATFFHTPLWHRLAEATFPECEDVTAAVELPGGGRAVLPLLRRREGPGGLLPRAHSTFAGCYGGLVADVPLAGPERASATRRLLDLQGPRFVLTGNPLGERREPPADRGRLRMDAAHLLPLDAPFDELFGRFSKGHRSSTTKGRREGVTTRRARSLDDYRAYFGAYEASLERWGEEATSRYPWALFENGWRLSEEHPGRIELWLAELGGRVLAGAWIFYWNGVAHYWHGAAHEEARDVSATNVLLADVIADACRRELRRLDMGPSGGHEGVAAFKRRFGAEAVEFGRRIGEGPLAGAMRSARRLARRLLRGAGTEEDR